MTDIVSSNTQTLLDAWMNAGRSGERFPIPFDVAYQLAGYSRKDSAKRALKAKTVEDVDFHTNVERVKLDQGGYTTREAISLSIDGFKHLCMMANNPVGRATREYFIDAEEKWRLVQQHAPNVAEEMEALKWKAEIAKHEAQRAVSEQKVIELRHYIVTTQPEPIQQKVLGYQVVKEVQYRDRTITPDGEKLDGIGITYIAQRFGFGKNTQKAWKWLESIGYGKDSGKWKLELSAVEAHKLPSEVLDELDELADCGDRQRWIGE